MGPGVVPSSITRTVFSESTPGSLVVKPKAAPPRVSVCTCMCIHVCMCVKAKEANGG